MTPSLSLGAAEVLEKYLIGDVYKIIYDIDGSDGVYLRDSATGKRYLDCNTFVASNPLGHNHPKLFDPEYEKRLLRAARVKVANSDFWTAEYAEFIETFVRLAVPQDFKHLFFVEGGAVAIENAVKAAFDWKVRLNLARGLKENIGNSLIYFDQAFHGRTGYAISLTITADPRKTKYFPRFDWPKVKNPKITFPLNAENLKKVVQAESEALEQIESILARREHDVAALVIEPIQSEGGDNHFRAEFHRALRRIADTHELLLIHDEVQTGVGITGSMWAHQHFGIVPDIMCFGKKTQVCGMMAGPRLDQVKDNVFTESLRINSTWGGNLVDMVRCARYLEIIEEERLVDNARVVGASLLRGLEDLVSRHPGLASNARGVGLLCSFDVATTEKRNAVQAKASEFGALVLKCGLSTVRLRPPLIFSEANVAELLDILDRSLKSVA